MSLDKNLFTLHVTPNKDNPDVVDLVDPKGVAHYRKQRVPGMSYKMDVYDPMSESLLITASAPSATSKHKTLELYNPTLALELKYTGTLTFRWGFKWEEHEFEWKREECFMLRKPDPPVLVAVTKEPAGRIKTSTVQILDYNLNRFDIDDRKGLEIVILTALLTFQDLSDAHHTPREENSSSGLSVSPAIGARKTSESAPLPPPKPAPKTGVDRIAEMQALRREVNEVSVEDEGSVNDYAQYCANLLEDEAMLFITVRSSAADQVPKVLQVVEQTKRIRYKAGLADDQELHQYVLYDAEPTPKGPKRINLNDGPDKDKSKADPKYAPPTSLTVHLSKIPMPELQPRANANSIANTKPSSSDKKEDKKDKAAREAEEKRRKKEEKKAQASKTSTNPSPSHSRTYLNQIHPNQPSPSPSQLNNPGIYTSPPPRPPQNPYSHPRPQPGPPPDNVPAGANLDVPGAINAQPTGQFPGGPPPGSSGAGPRPSTPSAANVATAVVSGLLDKFWHKP
jgi:hypothetical protein